MNSKSERPADQDQLPPVEWVIASHPVDYPDAVEAMSTHVEKIAAGDAAERIWLVEHPPLITAGTSAKPADLLLPDALPVYHSGRGGQYTYHGPGQRIAYVMLDLTRRQRDVRKLVQNLEGWIIDTLASFNVDAYTVPNRVGVWTSRPDKGIGREDKIAAIGIRLRKWVSFHGISLNVAPDLHLYDAIVPCGIADQGVTSLEDLGQIISMSEVDMALRAAFENRFGATI